MPTSLLSADSHVIEPPDHSAHLADRQRDRILHDSCADLYGITV
jgi:hypothetical protein